MDTVSKLAILAGREEELSARVRAATGLIEEKNAQLESQGVYAAYEQIHRDYVDLIAPGPDGLEALKRALFLQWQAVVEPSCFTGISNIDPEASGRVFEELMRLAALAEIDEELRWMASWYFIVGDYHFPAAIRPLIQPLVDSSKPLDAASAMEPDSLSTRGQMGRYWANMLRSHARRSST